MRKVLVNNGELTINDVNIPVTFSVFGEDKYICISESDIITYSLLITNIEIFGKPYWDLFKKKMISKPITIDYSLIEFIDKNIISWTRDKKLESIL